MGDLDLLLSIVSILHDACFTDEGWSKALFQASQLLRSSGAVLALESKDLTFPVIHYSGLSSESMEAYATEFQHIDPVITYTRSAPIGIAYPDWMAVDRHQLVSNRFTQDYGIRFDMSHCMQAFTDRGDICSGFFAVTRPERGGSYTDDDRRLTHALLPHMRQVLQIRRHLHMVEAQRLAALDALNRIDQGAFLVDADLKVIFTNRAGEDLLGARRGLTTKNGSLVALRSADTARLRGVVRRAFAGDLSAAPLQIKRPSSPLPLVVRVVPISARATDGVYGASPSIFVLVIDPDRRAEDGRMDLGEAFGLTPAETRVAWRLADGHRPAAISQILGVSVETIRTHLARIFDKTRTKGQLELAAMLLRCKV